jgi:hypothetical protein
MSTREFYSKIAGTSHNNPDGSDRQEIIKKYCKSEQPLFLIPEPDNPYDPNAVGVWIEVKKLFSTQRYQIGYLPSELVVRDLSKVIDGSLTAKVKELTGGTRSKPTVGVNIIITVI